MADLNQVATWIREARSVVVLTGAGISTESGIPDFRGPQGLWTTDPQAERLSRIDHYLSDPEIRKRAWRARLEHPSWTAAPNDGHKAIAALEEKGMLDTLITQNVDGLHEKAGSSPERTIQIHGSIREVMCMSCGESTPMQRALDRVRAGEEDPPCRSCGGILKSATISFGQSLVAEDLARAQSAAAGADVMMAVGISLVVYPVALLPQMVLARGSRLVIINGEATPYDELAHAVIRAPIGATLKALVALL